MNIDKLRCKETVKKLPKVIQPKKGKGSKYKRDKKSWKTKIQEE